MANFYKSTRDPQDAGTRDFKCTIEDCHGVDFKRKEYLVSHLQNLHNLSKENATQLATQVGLVAERRRLYQRYKEKYERRHQEEQERYLIDQKKSPNNKPHSSAVTVASPRSTNQPSSFSSVRPLSFKRSLDTSPHAPLQAPPDQTATEDRPDASACDSLDFNYDISFAVGFGSAAVEILKQCVEYSAGSRLSWWPLANPENDLDSDHVRVYSIQFRSARFYDDIPRTLAHSLFPKLGVDRPQRSAFVQKFLHREAVFLHDMTLMRILRHALCDKCEIDDPNPGWNSNNTGDANSNTTSVSPRSSSVNTSTTMLQDDNQSGLQLKLSHNDVSDAARPTNPTIGVTDETIASQDLHEPVLFLSVDVNSNQSVARAIKLGIDDKTTFQNLQKEYRRLCAKWFRVKHVTGIRFYRFRSFLFKRALNVHYIDLHKDRERYPEKLDPEYGDYCYKPQPWPADTPFPRNEVWHYLNHPEDCGTSGNTKDMLPIRIKGPITSHNRAFGMHLEERYSILAILLPSLVLGLLLLAPTGWFVGFWLNRHPNDLQNALVPASFAISALSVVLNIPISLLLFRWTTLGSG